MDSCDFAFVKGLACVTLQKKKAGLKVPKLDHFFYNCASG